jgi:hypothetical protein
MSNTTFLDNYAPFDDAAGTDAPFLPPEIRIDPPPVRSSAPSSIAPPSSQDLTEDQLRAYEDRLNMLESSISARETSARQNTTPGGEPVPNWPRFYPMVHYDIEDVPESLRHFVHEALFAWVLMAIAFLFNWIGCISLISVSDSSIESPGSKIALSSLYAFILVPLAIDLDALSVYRTLATNMSTFGFLKVFLALAITAVFETLMFLGLDSSGSVGLISTISLFGYGHIGLGVWGVIVTLAYLGAVALTLWLLKRLWSFYKGSTQGADMESDVRRGLAEFVVQRI